MEGKKERRQDRKKKRDMGMEGKRKRVEMRICGYVETVLMSKVQ